MRKRWFNVYAIAALSMCCGALAFTLTRQDMREAEGAFKVVRVAPEAEASAAKHNSCAGGDLEPIQLVDDGGRDQLRVKVESPQVDYLRIDAQVVDGAGAAVTQLQSKNFTFVVANGTPLQDGYVEKGATDEIAFTPFYRTTLLPGSYCEEIAMLLVVGDGHHHPRTIKRSRCFEVVGASRVPITVSEFSHRVTPTATEIDKFGKPVVVAVGTGTEKPIDSSKGQAVLLELASLGHAGSSLDQVSEINE